MALRHRKHLSAKTSRKALELLVAAADLPGDGWTVLREEAWRPGFSDHATDFERRARHAGCVAAYRVFDQGGDRRFKVLVTALADEADADTASAELGDRADRLTRWISTVEISEREVTLEAFPGARRLWARELESPGDDGWYTSKTLAAAVGRAVVVVSAGDGEPEWQWPELTAVAARQAARLAGA